MNPLLDHLKAKERRGSKPRCHWLTHGPADDVAGRLTNLAAPFARVSAADHWMPRGFEETAEPELDKASSLLDPDTRTRLERWWLASTHKRARTPNFDIASTCTIDGRPGLLLVEAKAHEEELANESAGKRLPPRMKKKDGSDDPTRPDGREPNHTSIGAAIASACDGLSQSTGLTWQISRDSHYQMSNRFAWAWKLTELELPVVLIYLGFLKAAEMIDRGRPFASHEDWERAVKTHSAALFPDEVWGRR
jgi:hypothetical protein